MVLSCSVIRGGELAVCLQHVLLPEEADNSIDKVHGGLSPEEAKLRWPPRAEDLQKLYVDEHLSAAKIAKAYGLKYASEKTAESTVLYHLKKAGVPRRDPAEHVRKVTPEMADEWVGRYKSGESLKQIAAGKVSPVTVYNQLRARGVVLRDKVEAQVQAVTKYVKTPFVEDLLERAYILGFVMGDCAVVRHGRAVRVRTATTHPAMRELFHSLFARYGFVKEYPRAAKLTEYELSLEVDLDDSFCFLLNAKQEKFAGRKGEQEFLNYLAGFFDADGGVYLHKMRLGASFEIYLVNSDEDLLSAFHERLLTMGFSSRMEQSRQSEVRFGASNPGMIWRVRLWRLSDVDELAKVVPSRHAEKKAKMSIVSKYLESHRGMRQDLISDWSNLLSEIEVAREAFIGEVKDKLTARRNL